MKTCLLLIIAIFTYLNWWSGPLAATEISYIGLEEIPLEQIDRWQQLLQTVPDGDKENGIVPRPWQDALFQLWDNTAEVKTFYQQLLLKIATTSWQSEEDLLLLAQTLMGLRQYILSQNSTDLSSKRKLALLLEALVVETLHYRFYLSGEQDVVTFHPPAPIAPWCSTTEKLNGHTLCTGDILLAKGGAASSSFIARIADIPGIHSHSTLVYLGKGPMLLIEALIEDGLRLRSPHKEYQQKRTTKLFAYRAKNPHIFPTLVEGIDRFVALMHQQLPTENWEDLLTTSAYPYNFPMDAYDFKKFFCSQVAWHIYQKAGLEDTNPYSLPVWSKVTSAGKTYLLSKFLETASTFPAPSDVEFNPQFQLLFAEFNPANLSKERIMVAFIDALFFILENNQRYLETFNQLLGDLGRQTVDPQQITAYLTKISQILDITIPEASWEIIGKIPKNVNYKQLIFFALLNEKLEPEISNLLLPMEKELWQSQHKIISHRQMRDTIYQILEQKLQNIIKKLQVYFPQVPAKE